MKYNNYIIEIMSFSKKQICKFYTSKNGCNKSDKCPYIHLDNETYKFYIKKQIENPQSFRAVCFYKNKEECYKHKKECYYIHQNDDVRNKYKYNKTEKKDELERQLFKKRKIDQLENDYDRIMDLRNDLYDEYEDILRIRDDLYTDCRIILEKRDNSYNEYQELIKKRDDLSKECEYLEKRKIKLYNTCKSIENQRNIEEIKQKGEILSKREEALGFLEKLVSKLN